MSSLFMPQLGEIKKGREIGKKLPRCLFIRHACEDCGKERWVRLVNGIPSRRRCLSCASRMRHKDRFGSNNGNWKGGQYQKQGYVFIFKPDHPNAHSRGYVKRARLVLEKQLGRYLLANMLPHHKNEIRDDDRPENLEELTRGKHIALHNKLRRQGVSLDG